MAEEQGGAAVLLGPNILVEVPTDTHLFFDAAVNKVILVTENTKLRALSSPPTLYTRHGLGSIAYDSPTPLEVELPDYKTALMTCPRIALDFSFVAVVRSTRLVHFIPIPVAARPGGAPSGPGTSRLRPIALTCKASKEPLLIFDCGWPFVDRFFLVTSQTLELYAFNASKHAFKLTKSTSLSIHWHVYSHVAKVVLAATNSAGNVLQPFLLKPDGVVKLPKLRMVHLEQDAVVLPSDVHLVVVYHKVFCIHIHTHAGTAALYHINRDEATLRAELPIDRGCAHKVSVVDGLLILHNVDRGTALVYDIKVSCRNALHTPRPLSSPASAPPPSVTYPFVTLDAHAPAGAAPLRLPPSSRRPLLFFAPDLVMDLDSGLVYSLLLDLSALAANFPDARRRVAFLLKREHCKVLVLHTLREMIWAKAPLDAIGQVFDMINEICALADREAVQAELAALRAASAAASKKSKRSWSSWFSSSSSSSAPPPPPSSHHAAPAPYDARAPSTPLRATTPIAVPADPAPGVGMDTASPSAAGLLSAATELGAGYSEEGGTIPLHKIPSPADAEVFDALVRSSLASSSQLLFEPPLGALGLSDDISVRVAADSPTSPILVTARTADGYAIIEQKEIYSYVLASMVEENKALSSKYKLAVLMEYIRSLSFHSRPVAHYLYVLIINLLVAEGKFHQLHQLIQYHVVVDSAPVALQLLSLDTVYPPAFQLALDMLKRLHNEDIVEVLLSRGNVLAALRFVREHGFRTVPVARFLRIALDSDDRALFFTVYQFFVQRNLYLRGNDAFLPEERCAEFVAAFHDMFDAPGRPAAAASDTQ